MRYAILGSAKIGTALARKFAQNKVEVGIANSRGPETLAALKEELGPYIVPQSIHEAVKAEVIFLAVPFSAHKEIAKLLQRWDGKTLIDATNALHLDPKELGGLLSSDVVAKAFAGAHLVKAFNHLPAEQLGDAGLAGLKQAIFIAANDADASSLVATLAAELGFAPVQLGRLDQGGVPLHVINGHPGGLLFQNLATVGPTAA